MPCPAGLLVAPQPPAWPLSCANRRGGTGAFFCLSYLRPPPPPLPQVRLVCLLACASQCQRHLQSLPADPCCSCPRARSQRPPHGLRPLRPGRPPPHPAPQAQAPDPPPAPSQAPRHLSALSVTISSQGSGCCCQKKARNTGRGTSDCIGGGRAIALAQLLWRLGARFDPISACRGPRRLPPSCLLPMSAFALPAQPF